MAIWSNTPISNRHTHSLGVEFALNGEEVRMMGREVVGGVKVVVVVVVRVVEGAEGNTAMVEAEEDNHLQLTNGVLAQSSFTL